MVSVYCMRLASVTDFLSLGHFSQARSPERYRSATSRSLSQSGEQPGALVRRCPLAMISSSLREQRGVPRRVGCCCWISGRVRGAISRTPHHKHSRSTPCESTVETFLLIFIESWSCISEGQLSGLDRARLKEGGLASGSSRPSSW